MLAEQTVRRWRPLLVATTTSRGRVERVPLAFLADAGGLSYLPAIVHQRRIADLHPHAIAYRKYNTAQDGEGNSTQIGTMRKTCYRVSHVAKGP